MNKKFRERNLNSQTLN